MPALMYMCINTWTVLVSIFGSTPSFTRNTYSKCNFWQTENKIQKCCHKRNTGILTAHFFSCQINQSTEVSTMRTPLIRNHSFPETIATLHESDSALSPRLMKRNAVNYKCCGTYFGRVRDTVFVCISLLFREAIQIASMVSEKDFTLLLADSTDDHPRKFSLIDCPPSSCIQHKSLQVLIVVRVYWWGCGTPFNSRLLLHNLCESTFGCARNRGAAFGSALIAWTVRMCKYFLYFHVFRSFVGINSQKFYLVKEGGVGLCW